jgi:aerobic-type carbon monoxide dehydrogenase small subunit (CoxS/CutS family)
MTKKRNIKVGIKETSLAKKKAKAPTKKTAPKDKLMVLNFVLNGKKVSVRTRPMERLLDVLREGLEHFGTKEGCGEGECGACAVLVNNELVNTCLMPALQVEGCSVRTIEGVKGSKEIAALQHAFVIANGTQCGFCTPGMIMAAVNLLEKYTSPSEEQIREAMAGNLCRCTGYVKIVGAVQLAAEELKKGRP